MESGSCFLLSHSTTSHSSCVGARPSQPWSELSFIFSGQDLQSDSLSIDYVFPYSGSPAFAVHFASSHAYSLWPEFYITVSCRRRGGACQKLAERVVHIDSYHCFRIWHASRILACENGVILRSSASPESRSVINALPEIVYCSSNSFAKLYAGTEAILRLLPSVSATSEYSRRLIR